MGQTCSISKQVTTSRRTSVEKSSRNCNCKRRKRRYLKKFLGKLCFLKIRNDKFDEPDLEILEQTCISK